MGETLGATPTETMHARPESSHPQDHEPFTFLAEAVRHLGVASQLDEALDAVAHAAREPFALRRLEIHQWDGASARLELAYRHPLGTGDPDEPASGGLRDLRQLALDQRRPLRLDASHPEGDARAAVSSPVCPRGAVLVVPLLTGDRRIGVLEIESSEPERLAGEGELLAQALAGSLALALRHERVLLGLRAREQKVEQDLSNAREIQQGLLPSSAPRMPGLEIGVAYRPARELGGDYYDFLPLSGSRLAIALGDVAGKSTPAAVYGSLAIGLLRGQVSRFQDDSPAELCNRLNEQLRLPRIRNRFLALMLAIYRHTDSSISLANAGLPWPYLVRDGVARRIRIQGLPLGVLGDVHYEETTLPLDPGDLLVFCSDGVLESENHRREQFGDVHLREKILELADRPAQVIAQELQRAGIRHGDLDGLAPDDSTVLVLKKS